MLKYAGSRPRADDSHGAGGDKAVRVKLAGMNAAGRLTGGEASIARTRRRCRRERMPAGQGKGEARGRGGGLDCWQTWR